MSYDFECSVGAHGSSKCILWEHFPHYSLSFEISTVPSADELVEAIDKCQAWARTKGHFRGFFTLDTVGKASVKTSVLEILSSWNEFDLFTEVGVENAKSKPLNIDLFDASQYLYPELKAWKLRAGAGSVEIFSLCPNRVNQANHLGLRD